MFIELDKKRDEKAVVEPGTHKSMREAGELAKELEEEKVEAVKTWAE